MKNTPSIISRYGGVHPRLGKRPHDSRHRYILYEGYLDSPICNAAFVLFSSTFESWTPNT